MHAYQRTPLESQQVANNLTPNILELYNVQVETNPNHNMLA